MPRGGMCPTVFTFEGAPAWQVDTKAWREVVEGRRAPGLSVMHGIRPQTRRNTGNSWSKPSAELWIATQWLTCAMNIVAEVLRESSVCVERVMQVTWFWLHHREAPLNERQRKALNLALSGSEPDDGWLTNRRYMKLSGSNAPLTASRDLAQLERLGIIQRDPSAGGRSTRDSIVLQAK